MKNILMIIVAMSFSGPFASARQYDVRTKPFQEPTVVQSTSELAKKIEGEYTLSKKSNLDCLPEGKLTVIKDGNTETLMMGGHILAMGIGRVGKVIDNDVNCNYTYETSYTGNTILGTDTKECGDRNITFHKKIEIQKDKLIIDRDAVENEKVVSKLNCVFIKIPNSRTN